MLDDGMVAIDGKIWGTKLSGKHRRGDAAAYSVLAKSVDPFSQTFTYDPLNRVTANTLGGVTNQSWTLDSQGNWSSFTSNGTTQTETANAQNQITSISGTSATPTYDANGNMTTDQTGNTYVYNAWNQLVSVANAAGKVIAQYTYNAMGYRVTESYPQGGNPDNGSNVVDIGTGSIAAGTVNYIYYNTSWSRRAGISSSDLGAGDGIQQLIKTRTNGTANSNVTSQTVWSAAYINAAVLQDAYSGGVIQPNSRLYFEQDANWDTTAVVGLVSGNWQVVQRYTYSPYGTITILNADWSTPPAGTNPMVSNLYQGMTLDSVTGLYYARNRNYSPSLGRWINQDPAGYINGANTYQFVMGNPVGNVDPWGEAVGIPIPNPAPTNWGPINQSTGQPDFLPPLPNGNPWVPVANPGCNPGNPFSRPVKWVPRNPTPGGSQPSSSWDPQDGYGTYDNGQGIRTHYGPDGEPLSPDEVQKYKSKSPKGPEEPGKCPPENPPADEPDPTIEDIFRLLVRIFEEGGADE